ncbi:MAG TPA: MJ0042-type zinc finger domain-containing protein, partial [Burkholderiaceae bacterium]|nr:MJ0042-type zinc finger domain-containing protein [Burkholderiaceae bacterium]
MSLAATCPQCHTLFRVVPDQLKLRGGMVRCGACQHVFNANLSLSFVAEDAIALRRRAQRLDSARPPRPAVQAAPDGSKAGSAVQREAAPHDAPPAAAVDASLERPSIAAFAEQRAEPTGATRLEPLPNAVPAVVQAQADADPGAATAAAETDAARLARREQRLARAKALREMQRAAAASGTAAAAAQRDEAADEPAAAQVPDGDQREADASAQSDAPAPILLSAIDTQDLAAAFLAREQAAERRAARWRRAPATGSVLA